jgi:hypothetical protein
VGGRLHQDVDGLLETAPHESAGVLPEKKIVGLSSFFHYLVRF